MDSSSKKPEETESVSKSASPPQIAVLKDSVKASSPAEKSNERSASPPASSKQNEKPKSPETTPTPSDVAKSPFGNAPSAPNCPLKEAQSKNPSEASADVSKSPDAEKAKIKSPSIKQEDTVSKDTGAPSKSSPPVKDITSLDSPANKLTHKPAEVASPKDPIGAETNKASSSPPATNEKGPASPPADKDKKPASPEPKAAQWLAFDALSIPMTGNILD